MRCKKLIPRKGKPWLCSEEGVGYCNGLYDVPELCKFSEETQKPGDAKDDP